MMFDALRIASDKYWLTFCCDDCGHIEEYTITGPNAALLADADLAEMLGWVSDPDLVYCPDCSMG